MRVNSVWGVHTNKMIRKKLKDVTKRLVLESI